MPLHIATSLATVIAMADDYELGEEWAPIYGAQHRLTELLRLSDALWNHTDLDGAQAYARLEMTDRDGLAVTGVLILSSERGITARDMRRVPLRTLVQAAEQTQIIPELLRAAGHRVSPKRPGSPGHSPEHWQAVRELYAQALRDAPRKPIKWMCQQWTDERGNPTPGATMRRWVKRIKEEQ